jgi:hypothetical protein
MTRTMLLTVCDQDFPRVSSKLIKLGVAEQTYVGSMCLLSEMGVPRKKRMCVYIECDESRAADLCSMIEMWIATGILVTARISDGHGQVVTLVSDEEERDGLR